MKKKKPMRYKVPATNIEITDPNEEQGFKSQFSIFIQGAEKSGGGGGGKQAFQVILNYSNYEPFGSYVTSVLNVKKKKTRRGLDFVECIFLTSKLFQF